MAGPTVPPLVETPPAGPAPQPVLDAAARRIASRVGPTGLAVGSLVVLSVLVYAVPAMLGHPVTPGDDLTQNLPLRELVGRDLRTGQLPVYDPFIWSGAPLLAGWNAGAAYPLTWLFAVLPGSAAWSVNLAAAAAVAATGTFAFLRASRLGVLASWLSGLTFAFGGAMAAQVPHLGLVTGMSWVPISLLAVLRISEPTTRTWRRRLAWTAALAGSVGMTVLAGEPRAIADGAVVVALYALWRLGRLAWHALGSRHDGGRADVGAATQARPRADALASSGPGPAHAAAAAAVSIAVGLALGAGLGAVQLLPGLAAVATSQRAQVTATLFSSGSLPAQWLLLLGVPDLLGGSGSLGQPTFFASYNLTEVTGYVGVLPLVAAGALAAGLPRPRRGRPMPEWTVWYIVGAVGVVLALGNHTPFWHLLLRIPLFGGQRLQSRSILITDLALAVLLGYWVDGFVRSGHHAPGRDRRPDEGGSRRATAFAVVPALAVVAVCVLALAARGALLGWMGAGAGAARAARLAPWLAPFLALGVLATVLAAFGRRLRPRWRRVAVSSFVVADLVVFALLTVVAVGAGSSPAAGAGDGGARSSGGAVPREATPVRPVPTLHLSGRFAVYDPTLLDLGALGQLGVPDANVVQGTYAVQGYSALVDGPYAAATGAHRVSGTGQDILAPSAIAGGVLDQLATEDLFVPAPYLVTREGSTADARTAATAPPLELGRGLAATWYLGTPIRVRSVNVTVVDRHGGAATAAASAVRIGVETPGGRMAWAPRVSKPARGRAGSWHAVLPSAVRAVAVAVELAPASSGTVTGPGAVVGAARPPVVTTPQGTRYVADGVLATALTAPHWAYAGTDGPFAVYRDRLADPPLRLVPDGASLAGGSVRRLSGPRLAPSAAFVSTAHGAGVVRAVADIPGWTATWHPRGGPAVALEIRRSGTVQAVTVPPGSGTVTWRYDAPELAAGEALSLAALAGVAPLVAPSALGGRLARRHRPSAGPTPRTVG